MSHDQRIKWPMNRKAGKQEEDVVEGNRGPMASGKEDEIA